MKLNKIFQCVFYVFFVALILLGCRSEKNFTEISFKDGMEDPFILEFYKEDIQAVNESLLSPGIQIYYADYDLNMDGNIDKICILSSSLHTGSHGDTVEFLVNIDGIRYDCIGVTNLRILASNGSPECNVYASDTKTNGYCYFVVRGFEYDDVIVYYNGDHYIDNLPY